MTTTNKNSEYQKSLAIYQEIAKYADEVFQQSAIVKEERKGALSAREILAKNSPVTIELTDDARYDVRTIEVEGVKCVVPAASVFQILQDFETQNRIKTADRATFTKAFTCEEKDVVAVCTLPNETKTLVKCCASDELRPIMAGVCLDFENGMVVTSDGRCLHARSFTGKVCDGKSLGGNVVPPVFAARHAGEEIKLTEKYAYAGKERAELLEGRYPRWQTVILDHGKYNAIDLGESWKGLRDCIVSTAKTDVDKHRSGVIVCGKKGEKNLRIMQPHWIAGRTTKPVYLDRPVKFDFAIYMNGSYCQNIIDATTMYVTESGRGILFEDADKNIFMLMPFLYDEEAREMIRELDIDPGWKVESPKRKPAPVSEAPAPVKSEDTDPAPAPVQETEPVCEQPEEPKSEETAEPVCEPVSEETEPEPVEDAQPVEIVKGMQVRVKGRDGVFTVDLVVDQRALVKNERGTRSVAALADIITNVAAPVQEPEPVCETVSEESSVKGEEAAAPAPAPVSEAPTQEQPTTDDVVYIAEYSEKAFAIWGDTKKYRKSLKKYGCWNHSREVWIFSNKRRELVEELIGEHLQAGVLPAAKPKATDAPAPVPVKGEETSAPAPAPVQEAEQDPVKKQYAAFKQLHPDAVILFRHGDFYEAYEDDAQVCADKLGIVLTQNGSMRMAGFPFNALDGYLPKLIRAGVRVAICDMPATNTKRTSAAA